MKNRFVPLPTQYRKGIAAMCALVILATSIPTAYAANLTVTATVRQRAVMAIDGTHLRLNGNSPWKTTAERRDGKVLYTSVPGPAGAPQAGATVEAVPETAQRHAADGLPLLCTICH